MARNAGRVSACSQFRSRLATHCAEYPFLGAGRGGVVHGLAERGGHHGNLWDGPAPRHTVGGVFFSTWWKSPCTRKRMRRRPYSREIGILIFLHKYLKKIIDKFIYLFIYFV